MEMKQFGQSSQSVIMLLHGGGLSWWNYKDEIPLLERNYHVVIPFLDGHSGSDRNFTSIEDNAAALIQYIETFFGGRVFAIGGLSLGGQILTEMLSQKPNICEYALIESALVIPMALTNHLLGSCVTLSYGLIKKQWFAKLQFTQLRLKPELYEHYYEDTCKISLEDMVAFLKCNASYRLKPSLKNTTANVVIAVGGKEQKRMLKSAKLLSETIANSRLVVLPDCGHGDLSIHYPMNYISLLLPRTKGLTAEQSPISCV